MSRRAWIWLLLALLSAALTARLGWWQLDRAAQKRGLQAAQLAEEARPPLGTTELLRSPALHRRVELQGRWMAERSIWLENRPMDGRVGFYVLTPLLLSGSDRAVLVQRGWVPRDAADRTRRPPLPDASGPVVVTGRLAATPSRVYELGQGQGGVIRQNLDPAEYAVEAGINLLPWVVVQTGDAGDGLLRHWPAADLGLQTHYGYAFQWFALTALILGLYVWFQLVRPRLRQRA
ncbi:MAG: transmembrane cytochrome oxidase [Roseateles depolymerans]|uniref:SURF1-like protein n=1 Tax=Roseateles depolymerans TaxID=76731 RepID=A0A2W5D7D2_9BURK|nr:MAG: transmembrane cytochrome oxidase [Roseateles depolymerans]